MRPPVCPCLSGEFLDPTDLPQQAGKEDQSVPLCKAVPVCQPWGKDNQDAQALGATRAGLCQAHLLSPPAKPQSASLHRLPCCPLPGRVGARGALVVAFPSDVQCRQLRSGKAAHALLFP